MDGIDGFRTHLLHTRRDQHSVLVPDPLRHQTPPFAGPGAVHLREQPLVGAERARVVEVDGVVQGDHHPDLLV